MKRLLTKICLGAMVFGLQAQSKVNLVNQIPDFSSCGYMRSEQDIPTVPVKAVVAPIAGDATASIQAAIDYVSSLTPDEAGFRGAVLLKEGTYRISSTLWIKTSGVVLRGSGMKETEILSTCTDKTTVLRVQGNGDMELGKGVASTDTALAVGCRKVNLPAGSFKAGDRVMVSQQVSMPMMRGSRGMGTPIRWEREVLSVEGTEYTIDAPFTCRMETVTVQPLVWKGRIEQVGIENLAFNSVYDERYPKDENHSWIAVALENVQNSWVRRAVFRHFAGSAVFVAETASRLTIEDCLSLEPVSEIGGQRRYSFYVKGPMCLLQRIQAEKGYHDFAIDGVHGPTALVQCWSLRPYSYSGTVGALSSGVLLDLCAVDDNAIRFGKPNMANAFDGYTATNSVLWNSQGAIVSCDRPAFGMNWSFGAWGGFNGKGYWYGSNNHQSPWSLFYAQLAKRTGNRGDEERKLIHLNGGGTSTAEDARFQTNASKKGLILLSERIEELCRQFPIDLTATPEMEQVWKPFVQEKAVRQTFPMQLTNSVLVRDGKVLTGTRHNPAWWRASMDGHIVRYELGPEGYGVVDNLEKMTDFMVERHETVTDFNYALWYERRRDDHERIARIDGDVRPPLYELPFGRSGEGQAYDGLSRYDLTRWNNWYWNRLRTYAEIADAKNLVLFYHHYFQHNILEAGAHWADFPWRPTNNVNETGFPDPTPYAGNKRVFMAEHFYDETHPVRRELHRNYIRKSLESFDGTGSVIHFISGEFSGPLHFTEFWVDVIREWEQETGKHPFIALSVPKNVQDGILADPERAKVIDVIDIRYWWMESDGDVYAPDGGLNLSPRQFVRIHHPKNPSAATVYEAVKGCREQYPGKAVVFSADGYVENGWAAFMAGASLCPLPAGLPEAFLRDAALLQPVYDASCWMLSGKGKGYIVCPKQGRIAVDLAGEEGSFTGFWLSVTTGEPVGKSFSVKGGASFSAISDNILWLTK